MDGVVRGEGTRSAPSLAPGFGLFYRHVEGPSRRRRRSASGQQSSEEVLLDQLRKELVERTYRPQQGRKLEIPKGGGKMRQLSIPSIRDRMIQGALKLILEPIFEADFQPGSFGCRPKKTADTGIQRIECNFGG
jgi:retron-type reverse transcriptase